MPGDRRRLLPVTAASSRHWNGKIYSLSLSTCLTFCRNFITSALRAIMSILSFERGVSGFFNVQRSACIVMGNGYHLALGDWRLVRITLLERKMQSLFCDSIT
jgi:hypothetical protein